jgi:3-oxoadipate enol-lactonase
MMTAAVPLVAEVSGDGDPVVMIHGLGGTSNTFQPLMADLSGYRVIRPDLPGSGRSALPVEALSIAGHAAAVLAFLRDAGVTRAHFSGHSMGTLVCQHIAARHPDCVASLALFGALTEPTEAARSGLIARAAAARQHGLTGIADQIIAATLAPRTHAENPAAVAFVRESILRQPTEGYARNCEALARATLAELRRITAPTLLVTGDCDPVGPVSRAQVLADGIAGATVAVLDRCGHWVTVEQAADAARLMADHLARHRI